jgi:carboxypeptidase Q
VVVVSGHIDSWDVGQGAQDDGVGCIIAMDAARLMQSLGLRPRRTVRVVLFTNEENGLRGGQAYRDAHRAELPDHVAMLESDFGNGPVQGFRLHLPPLPGAPATSGGSWEAAERATDDPALIAAREHGLALLESIAVLLEPLGATRMRLGGSGADVGPSVEAGAVGVGVDHDGTHYFDIHHTAADTFEKVSAEDLARNVASVAVMAYLLAELPDRLLPRGVPQPTR